MYTRSGYVNPGEDLFNWILDRYKRQEVSEDTWVANMAREFDMEGLEDLLFRSTALMVLRRLLWNAAWYESRYIERSIVETRFEKDYLLGTFGFDPDTRRRMRRLTFAALDVSRQDISEGDKRQLKLEARKREAKCNIRGCAIDYDAPDQTGNSFSLDHIWPRSLGGVSRKENLQVACYACNSMRQNIADASDVHYEHFHVKKDWSPDNRDSFWKELRNEFRIAILMKFRFQCAMCGSPVEDMEGGLDFQQRNKDESFNIFNIQVACRKHRM